MGEGSLPLCSLSNPEVQKSYFAKKVKVEQAASILFNVL